MAVAAPEATLSGELSLGLEFLDEEQLDTASWLLGESTFDLLLGGQSQQPIQAGLFHLAFSTVNAETCRRRTLRCQ